MEQLYLYSFAFIGLALVPLWFDANRRAEYGTRSKYLMAAIALFLAIGAGNLALFVTGTQDIVTRLRFRIAFVILYSIVLHLTEYSIHLQRIKKNLLEHEFRVRLLIVGALIGAAVLSGAADLLVEQTLLANEALSSSMESIITFGAFTLKLILFVSVTGSFLYGIWLFDLQEGIIRKRDYTYIVGTGAGGLIVLLALLNVDAAPLVLFLLLAMNLAFAVRVFHEYFLYRMNHLNQNYDQKKRQDEAHIELINRVLLASRQEDVEIITETLKSTLERLRESVQNPNMRSTSLMLFRRNGDVLSVDSADFIIGYCVPLINSETIKRMKPDVINQHIMSQVFDVKELATRDFTGDFAGSAFKAAFETRKAHILTVLPEHLSHLFRLIAFYPVFAHRELVSVVVLFKDSSDYVFPQESVIIEELVSQLSIVGTLIDGKRMQEDKNRLNQEMDVAKQIQVSILPKRMEIEGFDVATSMTTASEVGGDLYDFIKTPFGNYIDVGDVSGHGLPAGMMALIHMAALHGALAASETCDRALSATELYDIINRVLIEINRDRIGSDKFMTCNMFLEKGGTFTHAGSHMIAALYRASSGTVQRLDALIDHAAFLGISEFASAKSSHGEFSMETGDVLVLYTDGLTEARDRRGDFYGLERLEIALAANAKSASEDIRQAIFADLSAFAESGDFAKYGGNFADDVSILVIKKN